MCAVLAFCSYFVCVYVYVLFMQLSVCCCAIVCTLLCCVIYCYDPICCSFVHSDLLLNAILFRRPLCFIQKPVLIIVYSVHCDIQFSSQNIKTTLLCRLHPFLALSIHILTHLDLVMSMAARSTRSKKQSDDDRSMRLRRRDENKSRRPTKRSKTPGGSITIASDELPPRKNKSKRRQSNRYDNTNNKEVDIDLEAIEDGDDDDDDILQAIGTPEPREPSANNAIQSASNIAASGTSALNTAASGTGLTISVTTPVTVPATAPTAQLLSVTNPATVPVNLLIAASNNLLNVPAATLPSTSRSNSLQMRADAHRSTVSHSAPPPQTMPSGSTLYNASAECTGQIQSNVNNPSQTSQTIHINDVQMEVKQCESTQPTTEMDVDAAEEKQPVTDDARESRIMGTLPDNSPIHWFDELQVIYATEELKQVACVALLVQTPSEMYITDNFVHFFRIQVFPSLMPHIVDQAGRFPKTVFAVFKPVLSLVGNVISSGLDFLLSSCGNILPLKQTPVLPTIVDPVWKKIVDPGTRVITFDAAISDHYYPRQKEAEKVAIKRMLKATNLPASAGFSFEELSRLDARLTLKTEQCAKASEDLQRAKKKNEMRRQKRALVAEYETQTLEPLQRRINENKQEAVQIEQDASGPVVTDIEDLVAPVRVVPHSVVTPYHLYDRFHFSDPDRWPASNSDEEIEADEEEETDDIRALDGGGALFDDESGQPRYALAYYRDLSEYDAHKHMKVSDMIRQMIKNNAMSGTIYGRPDEDDGDGSWLHIPVAMLRRAFPSKHFKNLQDLCAPAGESKGVFATATRYRAVVYNRQRNEWADTGVPGFVSAPYQFRVSYWINWFMLAFTTPAHSLLWILKGNVPLHSSRYMPAIKILNLVSQAVHDVFDGMLVFTIANVNAMSPLMSGPVVTDCFDPEHHTVLIVPAGYLGLSRGVMYSATKTDNIAEGTPFDAEIRSNSPLNMLIMTPGMTPIVKIYGDQPAWSKLKKGATIVMCGKLKSQTTLQRENEEYLRRREAKNNNNRSSWRGRGGGRRGGGRGRGRRRSSMASAFSTLSETEFSTAFFFTTNYYLCITHKQLTHLNRSRTKCVNLYIQSIQNSPALKISVRYWLADMNLIVLVCTVPFCLHPDDLMLFLYSSALRFDLRQIYFLFLYFIFLVYYANLPFYSLLCALFSFLAVVFISPPVRVLSIDLCLYAVHSVYECCFIFVCSYLLCVVRLQYFVSFSYNYCFDCAVLTYSVVYAHAVCPFVASDIHARCHAQWCCCFTQQCLLQQSDLHLFLRQQHYRSYGLLCFFNHFMYAMYHHALQIMIRDCKDKVVTAPIKAWLTRPSVQQYIQHRFQGSHICVAVGELWASVFYERDSHHIPLLNLLYQLAEASRVKIEHRQPTQRYFTPIPDAVNQYSAFISDSAQIKPLVDFLQHADNQLYCVDAPKYRHNAADGKYLVTWSISPDCNPGDMIAHWAAQHSEVYINKSNYNSKLISWQSQADVALQTYARHAIFTTLQDADSQLYLNMLFHMNIVFKDSLGSVDLDQRKKLLRQYPALQIFDPYLKPYCTQLITQGDHKLLFLNVGGSVQKKFTNQHAWIRRILSVHQPHIIALADIQLASAPVWTVPGYSLKIFKRGAADCKQRTGGILVFVHNSILNQFQQDRLANKHNVDLVWYRINRHRYGVAYCRPDSTKNRLRTTHFYNQLNANLTHFSKDPAQYSLTLVGDFNARCGQLTGERNNKINTGGRKLMACIDQHELSIANAALAHGIPTFRDSRGHTAIDDHTLTNSTDTIADLTIDTSPMFNDHRPIVLTLRNPTIQTQRVDTVFGFNRQPFPGVTERRKTQIVHPYAHRIRAIHADLLEYGTSDHNVQLIADVVSYFAYYFMQKAIIQINGIRKVTGAQSWEHTNLDLIDINARIDIANEQPDNYDAVKILQQQYDAVIQRIDESRAQYITDQISSVDYSDNAKKLKYQFKKLDRTVTDEFLEVDGTWTDRKNALRRHYKSIMAADLTPSNDAAVTAQIQSFANTLSRYKGPTLPLYTPDTKREDNPDPEHDLLDPEERKSNLVPQLPGEMQSFGDYFTFIKERDQVFRLNQRAMQDLCQCDCVHCHGNDDHQTHCCRLASACKARDILVYRQNISETYDHTYKVFQGRLKQLCSCSCSKCTTRHWHSHCNKRSSTCYADQHATRFNPYMAKPRKKSNQPTTSAEQVLGADVYKKLFRKGVQSNKNKTKKTTIEAAIAHTNRSGAAGYDCITQPMIKESGISPILAAMHQAWLDAQYIPEFCMIGIILCLPKNNNPTQPKHFRPVTLLPIPFKIFERIIVWKLDKYDINHTLHTLQGGFHYKRGVLEQLGTLRVVSNLASQKDLPLYVASLDIRKAYDMVWRDAITYKLHHQFNVPIALCRMIQAMLSGTRSGLRHNSYISHIFRTANGVVQGSVVAPLLYGVFINDLVSDLVASGIGAHYLTVERIAALFYCDDILLLTHAIPELKLLLAVCENHSKKWRYQFNPDKCHVFSFNSPEPTAFALTYTQQKDIQKAYNSSRVINRNNQDSVAPLVVQQFDVTKCSGTSIYGCTRHWLYNNLPPKLAKQLRRHKSQTKHIGAVPFPIYWKQTTSYAPNSTFLQLQQCQMYGARLQYSPLCRYLGAEMHVHDPHNIISIKHTMARFLEKMRSKVDLLCRKLPINIFTLPHYNLALLSKCFLTAYTEVFAQIMPIAELEALDAASTAAMHSALPYPFTDDDQIHYFNGNAYPTKRWEIHKMLYLRNLCMNPTRSELHASLRIQPPPDLPFYREFFSIKHRILPEWNPFTDENIETTRKVNLPPPVSSAGQIQKLHELVRGQLHYSQDTRFVEQYDSVMLDKLLMSDLPALLRAIGRDDKVEEAGQLKRQLFHYQKKSRYRGMIDVRYRWGRNDPVRRCRRYSSFPSLQSMWKPIRGALGSSLYYDCDFCNCHPMIIHHLCNINDIRCPELARYVLNREGCLAQLMSEATLSRSASKELYLNILNGGSTDIITTHPQCLTLHLYASEVAMIYQKLKQQYPDIHTYAMHTKAVDEFRVDQGVFFSQLCLRIENYILQLVIDHVNNRFPSKPFCQKAVLIYDGIMLPRSNWSCRRQARRTMDSIESLIKKHTGMTARIKIKQLDETIVDLLADRDSYQPTQLPIEVPINCFHFAYDSDDNVQEITFAIVDEPLPENDDEDSKMELLQVASSSAVNNPVVLLQKVGDNVAVYDLLEDAWFQAVIVSTGVNTHTVQYTTNRPAMDYPRMSICVGNIAPISAHPELFLPRPTYMQKVYHTDKIYPSQCPAWLKQYIDTQDLRTLKANLIQQANFDTLHSFHPHHPFRVIDFCPSTWKAFHLIPQYSLKGTVSDTEYREYMQLFYDFGVQHTLNRVRNVCNLCQLELDLERDSVEYHTLLDCPALAAYRLRYFAYMHNLLVDVYQRPGSCHQLQFGQTVLEVLEDSVSRKKDLWLLISGANYADMNPETHNVCLRRAKVAWRKYDVAPLRFYSTLIRHLMKWYRRAQLSVANWKPSSPLPLDYITKKCDKLPEPRFQHFYHRWINNNDEFVACLNNVNYNPATDVLIATDASVIKHIGGPGMSRAKTTSYAGLGAYIRAAQKELFFYQMMGSQTINYCELTAVGKGVQLQIELGLGPVLSIPRRIIIATDSAYTYKHVYSNVTKHSLYPHAQKQVQETVWANEAVMLLKVKSHLDRANLQPIHVNEQADQLAGVASSQCQELRDRFAIDTHTPIIRNRSDFSKAWIHDFECGSKTDLWSHLGPLDTG